MSSIEGGVVADDEALLDLYPGEPIDHDSKHRFRGFANHRLVMGRCVPCGHWFSLPSPCCPRCQSFDLNYDEVAGTGRVYSLVRLHQGPATPGVDYATPYPVAIVELDDEEGLRITTPILESEPGEVSVDDAVELAWIDRAGAPFPAFRRVGGRTPR